MLQKHLFTAFVLTVFFAFSCWLMFSTFGYDEKEQNLMIANKVNSDFISHIALIRSFSLGDNLTRVTHGRLPEYPLFPGEPIRYHFIFYMLVGLLEKVGLRIDWALNVPSIMGFFLLLTMIYLLAKYIFKDVWVALLSVLLFLFNGSFAFIRFFNIHPLSSNSFRDIYENRNFPAFGPWDSGEIAAFWNLNIYTNQRHLALAYGLVLLFIYTSLRLQKESWSKQRTYALIWGLVFWLLPYFHQPSLLLLGIIIASYWFLFPNLRKYLFLIGLVALMGVTPQLLGIRHGESLINWFPGYLIHGSLTLEHFYTYWLQNIGFHVFFIPLGFLLVFKETRKIFIPLIPIFIIPNLVTFSPEAAANHKFFNLFIILGNMLTAYTLVLMASRIKKRYFLARTFGFLTVMLFIFSLTLSGVIDIFAMKNDIVGSYQDISSNPLASWVFSNTKPSDVFISADYINPISLTGRKLFLGWPYFAWSAGYNTYKRTDVEKKIFQSDDVSYQCKLLSEYGLHYILLVSPQEALEFTPNYSIFVTHGYPLYTTDTGNIKYTIYSVNQYCKGYPGYE